MPSVRHPRPGHQHQAIPVVRPQLRVLLRGSAPDRGARRRASWTASSRRASARRSSTSPPTTRRPTGSGWTPRSTNARCGRSTCRRSNGSSPDASRGPSCAPTTRSTGLSASENHWLLTTVLRDEWGFQGLVVSDWGAVYDRVPALAAGLDLEMPPDLPRSPDRIVGRRRVRRPRPNGCWTRGRAPCWNWSAKGWVCSSSTRTSTRTSTTGWPGRPPRNRSSCSRTTSGILPLDPGSRIAVIGEFARTPRFQGAGSSQVNPTRVENALDELTAVHRAGHLRRRVRHRRHRRRRGAARRGRPGRRRRRHRRHAPGAARRGRVRGLRPHPHEPARPTSSSPCGRSRRPTRTSWSCWSTGPPWSSATSRRTPAALVEAWLGGQAAGGAIATCCPARSTRRAGSPRPSRTGSPTTPPT